jgi:hypothetical protein
MQPPGHRHTESAGEAQRPRHVHMIPPNLSEPATGLLQIADTSVHRGEFRERNVVETMTKVASVSGCRDGWIILYNPTAASDNAPTGASPTTMPCHYAIHNLFPRSLVRWSISPWDGSPEHRVAHYQLHSATRAWFLLYTVLTACGHNSQKYIWK